METKKATLTASPVTVTLAAAEVLALAMTISFVLSDHEESAFVCTQLKALDERLPKVDSYRFEEYKEYQDYYAELKKLR